VAWLLLRGELRTVSEDQRERDDEHEDLDPDVAGWLGRNLDDSWVMVAPGIYRLREDMPGQSAGQLDEALRLELPGDAPVEPDRNP